MRKPRVEEHEGGMERWLLTYADMITLLLALFIVLFAFSSIDVKKFLELKLGLTSAFNPSAISTKGGAGLLNATSLVSSPGTNSSSKPVLVPEQGNQSQGNAKQGAIGGPSTETIAAELSVALERAQLQQLATVTITNVGVVVNIVADKLFYATGSADLGPVGDQIVDVIATVVRGDPNDMSVEGFTDNQPISTSVFASNWQLSAARAANVVQRLAEVDSIQSTRLSVAGFGPTHPIATNETNWGRAANRRVDVVILSSDD